MDPAISLTPILRIDPLAGYQGSKQEQRTPFSQGQILQGLISGKTSDNQFLLEVDGRRVVADSKAALNIGQKLDLQVAQVQPRVILQVVSDPLTQNIGKSIHLLDQQSQLLPGVATLFRETGNNPALPESSRQVLQLFTQLTSTRPAPSSGNVEPATLLPQLLSQLADVPAARQAENILPAIQNLLQQLVRTAPSSSDVGSLAARILESFSDPGKAIPLQLLVVQTPEAGTAQATVSQPQQAAIALLNQLLQLQGGNEKLGQVIGQLLKLFTDNEHAAPTRLCNQLLELSVLVAKEKPLQSTVGLNGQHLKQMADKMGLNLEQLLAVGNREEAVQTLKNALFDITRIAANNEKQSALSGQLLNTLELYQMVQVRLASDSIFFFPLPLPFLDQGFLMTAPDKESSQGTKRNSEENKIYSLHLKLEGLGNLQIDINHQHDSVSLRFLTQDTERTRFLADHRNELPDWLTALKLESARFLTGADDPTRQLLSRMISGTTGVVDTRA